MYDVKLIYSVFQYGGDMKDKIINIIAVLLIVIGISLIGYIAYSKYESSKDQDKMKTEFYNIIHKSADKDKGKDKDSKAENTDKYEGPKPIALLKIPKINVEVGVAEGTSDYVLRYAAGHFEKTALPGQKGNFAVAGHRNLVYADYFADLDKLTKGDKVIVSTKDGDYTYIVEKNFIVSPDHSEVLNKTDDATITMVTCTFGAKNRIIVTGKLQK